LQHVRIGLAVLGPAYVIRRHDRHGAGCEMPPELLHLRPGPDRGIDLGLPPKPLDVALLVQREVMDAGLHRRVEALRAIGRHEFIAAADRAMYDVDWAAGASAKLVDLRDGERFGDWGPRQALRGIV